MTWTEYIFQHLIPTGLRSFVDNFRMWKDLITSNYQDYVLLEDDDPYEQCYEWFWTSINLDETYPKEFLEYLQQMIDDIDSGKVKTYPMNDIIDRMKELVGDVEVDLDEELEED